MEITYKNLTLINFPIYGLPSEDLYVEDGVLFYKSRPVDDRNVPGETIGIRRAQTPLTELFKLHYCYRDIGSMISNTKHNVYVDSKGYCFKYRKTKVVKVICKRIKKVIKKDTHTILVVHEVPSPFALNSPPPEGVKWVSLIYLGKQPWLPYEYSYEFCATRKRKI